MKWQKLPELVNNSLDDTLIANGFENPTIDFSRKYAGNDKPAEIKEVMLVRSTNKPETWIGLQLATETEPGNVFVMIDTRKKQVAGGN